MQKEYIYILKVKYPKKTYYKLGYSTNPDDRIFNHIMSNPGIEIVDVIELERGKDFESYFHKTYMNITKKIEYNGIKYNPREWYDRDIFPFMIKEIKLWEDLIKSNNLDKYLEILDELNKEEIIKFNKKFSSNIINEIYDCVIEKIENRKNCNNLFSFVHLVKYFNDNHVDGQINWSKYSFRYEWIAIINSCYKMYGKVWENLTYTNKMVQIYKENNSKINLFISETFKINIAYTKNEIKLKLSEFYKQNNININAKATDIREVFNVRDLVINKNNCFYIVSVK